MTVICGFYDKKTKKIYIGADRGIFNDKDVNNYIVSQEPKILKKKIGSYYGKPISMIMGNAGDAKPGNILTHWQTGRLKFDPVKETPHQFLVNKFIPEMVKQLEKHGYKKPDTFDLVVAFEGEIFTIDEAYAVTIPSEWGVGVGAAKDPALGVLYALNTSSLKNKIPPKKKLEMALKASVNITNYAKEPFDIITV